MREEAVEKILKDAVAQKEVAGMNLMVIKDDRKVLGMQMWRIKEL